MMQSVSLSARWKGLLFIVAASIALSIMFLLPKSAAAYGTTLGGGESLQNWAKLESSNGEFAMIMQSDGNLVNYLWPHAYWATNTAGNNGARVVMQTDGNLVIYRADGVPIWASNTAGNPGAYLILQDDGNLVMRNAGGGVIWSPNAVPTRLHSGQALQGRNWQIFSPDRRYRMVMQTDGNAVVMDGNVAIWASHTQGNNGAALEMQTDGNLVVYGAGHVAKWASNSSGPNGSYLEGQNDGNFVIYAPNRAVLWSTKGSQPSGTAAQLAQQILNNNRIERPGRCVTDDLTRTANGQVTQNGSRLDAKMLANTLAIAQSQRIKITSITGCGSGHADGSHHYSGKGIDLQPATGTLHDIARKVYENRGGWNIHELIHDPMPSGTTTLKNGAAFTYNAQTRAAHRTHVHFSTK